MVVVAALADERCRSGFARRAFGGERTGLARAMPRKKAAPRRNDVAGAVPAEDARRVRGASSGDDVPAKRGRFARAPPPTTAVARLVPRGGDALVIATIAGVPTRVDDAASAPLVDHPTHVLFERASVGDRVRWRFLRHAPDDASAPDRCPDPDPDGLAWRAERPPSEDAAVAFIELVRDGALAVVGPADPSGALSLGVTPAATRDPPSHPEEVSRRRAHARLRTALAWLAPPSTRRERVAAGIESIPGDGDGDGDGDGASGDGDARGCPSTPASPGAPAGHSALRDVYDAARPPRDTPPIEGDFPELVPTPRPYQRRAVGWMVRRERGGAEAATKSGEPRERREDSRSSDGDSFDDWGGSRAFATHPLWSALPTDDPKRPLYVNWHTGQTTSVRFPPPRDVRGGILADEMGLGKTVELLMCVLANRYVPDEKNERDEEDDKGVHVEGTVDEGAHVEGTVEGTVEGSKPDSKLESNVDVSVKREAATDAATTSNADEDSKDETVNCACGATDADYEGMWLACDDCGAWSHARCVGYTKTDERRHFRRAAAARKAADDARDRARRVAAHARAHADESLERAVEEAEKAANEAEKAAVEAESTPPFSCGACVASKAGETFSGPCGATLVVCPAPILPQWRSEIARHAKPGALRVLVYEGQPRDAGGPVAEAKRRRGASALGGDGEVVSARDLAEADVVLTTYDVLRHDLHHNPSGSEGRAEGRNRRRYRVLPTPLTRLTWWRVVLDEAQEVESSAAAAGAMARLVPGTHRWAVTGTPVSRGLEDLQGLFAFLGGPSPLTDAGWWRRMIQAPRDAGDPDARRALRAILRRVMWRNARRDVADELRLPPQGQTVTWLRPSGIEAHWYAQQRRVCEGAAREALRRVRDPRKRTKKEIRGGGKREEEEDDDDDDGDADEVATIATAAAAAAAAAARRARAAMGLTAAGPGRRLDGDGEDAFADLIDDGESEHEEDATAEDAVDSAVRVDLTMDSDDEEDRYLTVDESRRVLAPLLRLRQACNHPQAGTHGVRGLARGSAPSAHIGAGGIHAGAIMTMPQIHAVLIEKQRTEAEEAQRLVAFTLNASAGVAMCRGRHAEAVAHYREVLRLEAAGAADGLGLRLDALQRLHALHNLRLALDAAANAASNAAPNAAPNAAAAGGSSVGFAPVSRALRDDSLASDAETERQKYVAQRAGGSSAAADSLRKATAAVEDARRRSGARGRGPSGCAWWSAVVDAASAAPDRGRALFDRVTDAALGGSWQGRQIAFADLSGFRYALESDLAKMGDAREKFLERVAHLTRVTAEASEADVDAAGKCGVCVSRAFGEGEAFGGINRRNLEAVVSRARVVCQHCAAEPVVARYEDLVFGHAANNRDMYKGRGNVAQGDVGSGRSAPSSAETALRFLASRVPKSGLAAAAAAEAAAAHLEAMEGMRREFTRASELIKRQRDELKARDELVMATTRIRVRAAHEIAVAGLPDPIPEHLRASVVHEWELDDMDEGYAADRAAYEADLRRAASQVRFLERLRSEDAAASDGGGAGPGAPAPAFECPVCHEDVDRSAAAAELAVLPCGHKLCVSCTDALVTRAPPPPPRQPRCFKCPTCRVRTPADEINYVSAGSSRQRVERWPAPGADSSVMDLQLGTEEEHLEGEAALVVRGSWGTKVEAVTRRVLWLLDGDRPGASPDVKAIVFSEWEDALRVVAAALRANGVAAEHPSGGGRKLRDAIERFKRPAEAASEGRREHGDRSGANDDGVAVAEKHGAEPPPRVLLMPLRRGANGLNLTEAQHVILLEPVLDPGAEAQAMKRVDRIGQTRPTCVHRFLLAGTVEENVQELSRRRREAAPGEAEDVGRARGGAGTGLKISEAGLLIEGKRTPR